MNKAIDAGLAIGLSAVAGAAVMYLLDPEAGQKRRSRLSEAAIGAAGTTGSTLHTAMNQVGARAGHAGSRIGHVANDLMDQAMHAAGYVKSRAQETIEDGRDWIHPPKSHKAATAAALGISGTGALALGLAAMYLLDPRQGEERRTALLNKANGACSDIGAFARRIGRYVSEKVSSCSTGGKTHIQTSTGDVGDTAPDYETRDFSRVGMPTESTGPQTAPSGV